VRMQTLSGRSKGSRVNLKGRPLICRRPRAHPSCSQRSCCSAGSTARELNAIITCGSLERRPDGGGSSPLIIYGFDVADQIADDF
jgi:hypothetical protein